MDENELAKIVVDVAYHVHTKMGPGLLESAYQAVMTHELRKRGLKVENQVPRPVIWEDIKLDVGFRMDLFVERKLIVELKSVEQVAPVHKKQLLTYLRLSDCRLGLLINFGSELIKHGISRVVNGLKEKDGSTIRREDGLTQRRKDAKERRQDFGINMEGSS